MSEETTPRFVSNEVLASKLDTLTDEVRELRRELVRRDVYEAQRSADQARIAALEKQQQDAAGLRRQLVVVGVVSTLGFITSIVLALLRPVLG